jgi:putative glycosyltransferase
MNSAVQLSIVTTLYRSAGTIAAFCARAMAAADAVLPDYEIIIVDDGSPDDSLKIALGLARLHPQIRIVELSRNFGHHKALMTGLDHSRGDLIFLIDSDLDEDPALLAPFHARLVAEDGDVVYGFQAEREGSLVRRVSGGLAFRLINALAEHKIPANHLTVRLMRREYVDALCLHRERQTIMGGLWVITGFRQSGIAVQRSPGRSPTTYSFVRRVKMLIDSITAFSETPLVMIFYLGLGILALTTVVSGWVLAQKIINGGDLQGWVSVMLSVWFLGGLAIFSIGVVGIYVSKIFIETKHRPYTIIRRVHTFPKEPPA